MNKNLKELIDYSQEGIISKVILKEDDKNVTLFSMAKDTSISDHTTTRKAIVYIIEGEEIGRAHV